MTTWQEAARGIPVWPSAYFYSVGYERKQMCTEISVYTNPPIASGVYGYSHQEVIVALDHPDTRAAYDRRLAVALGAPADVVDDGVVIEFLYGEYAMVLFAGPSELGQSEQEFAWTSRVELDRFDDPILARALAWPTEQRIPG